MTSPLGDMDPGQFLQEFWQKKPCLIRQAITGFEPFLDGNDLAGLACEEMAESRLVSGTFAAADWHVEHGPFNESFFDGLPEQDWTLLVQDVEKHYAPLQDLMQQFSFIPNWRLDDLMISFAASGGSVGPHTDQYDVFLLQAEGRRRWQIATSFDPQILEPCALNVLKQFDAEQDWILEPGDMLYLPPNIAHYGVALEPGMTWSIGSRAPSGADLLQGLGEWLAFRNDEGGRYSDPHLQAGQRAGEIDKNALQGLAHLMQKQLAGGDELDLFLAAFMSRFRLANEPVALAKPLQGGQLQSALQAGATLMRNPWTRMVWIAQADGALLYAAGQAYGCSVRLAEHLCRAQQICLDAGTLSDESIDTLTQLVNNGHLLIIEKS
jgi:50S ribosomal protein L16 3-hydroxylase